VKVHPALRYTTLRLSIFVAVLLLLSLLRIRGLLLLLLAVLVSGLISYPLLSKPRDAMSGAVAGGIQRFRRSIDASARAEDTDDEEGPGDRRARG
jgi:hypothetical protein